MSSDTTYKAPAYKIKSNISDKIFTVCNTIFMLLVVVVMLFPMVNQLAISFNDPLDSIRGGIYIWPRQFSLLAYQEIFSNPLLFVAFRNTIARTIIATVGGLFVCSMVGYVLSRKEFVINKFVTVFFVTTMYVSAGLIPAYFLFSDLGLINHFNVYWLPGLFGAFNVIVIRSYMQGLPDSLVEAARIDGAGEFRIYAQVILPICKPVLATVGLWIAVGSWNNWFDTMVFAPADRNLTTLQFELMRVMGAAFAAGGGHGGVVGDAVANIEAMTPIAMRAAITIVASVPILMVYPFLQKYFVKGVHVGSVKG